MSGCHSGQHGLEAYASNCGPRVSCLGNGIREEKKKRNLYFLYTFHSM